MLSRPKGHGEIPYAIHEFPIGKPYPSVPSDAALPQTWRNIANWNIIVAKGNEIN